MEFHDAKETFDSPRVDSLHSTDENVISETYDITSCDNIEKKAARVKGRRSRAGCSDSWSSQDFSSLTMEIEEGVDECYPEEALVEGIDECSEVVEGVLDSLRSVESETACSKASTSSDSEDHHHHHNNPPHWSGFFGLLRKGSGIKFQAFPSRKNVPKLTKRKTKRIRETTSLLLNSPLDAELCHLKSSWKNFSFLDLQAATNGFSPENLIGQGGYAEVYKGELSDGQHVAIKRLTKGSPEEMTMDFLSELGIIVHVDHPNIAKLIGYGVEGGMHLVLQLSPHGSLASLLYGSKEKLDWDIRFKIAVGTASGLTYLHEGCQRRIIHKDIKASNILLTEDFEPQISDFGLSKWLPDQWTHHTVSKVEGTFGYLPPELFMHGIVDEKTDVYGYGVLLLELITGKQAVDGSQTSLVMWAKPLIQKNSMKKLADPALGDAYDLDQLQRLALTAFMCVHQSSNHRPQMSQVVQHLKSAESILELVEENLSSENLVRTYSDQVLDADDNSTSKYLNDLNRHMEIVLGPSTDS
ncbi:receptor-like cytosolic serine/threonine-protein kinase RBK2 [Pistacia vera]|uniref:receptor-like cytosolic serine/threonine-protein kinase RBK2 n=1 Tax=Pistacia vera TaxID=55513 RepID=UPI001262F498|nr:receptor-like cytosolic serine/threonine-protein kinase RBK2 [Pistacia vera]